MLHKFTARLLANAAFLAPLFVSAQEGVTVDDLGVMSISLKDVVKPPLGRAPLPPA